MDKRTLKIRSLERVNEKLRINMFIVCNELLHVEKFGSRTCNGIIHSLKSIKAAKKYLGLDIKTKKAVA